ncbi:MAG: hypothetical protein AAF957_12410 [Planctomycetota bacterium]
MSRPLVIRARAHGMARRGGRVLLFAGAALLPVALMGVTVPSAVAVQEARDAQADCRVRLDERNSLATKLAGYESEGVIDEVEALERVLRGLVPTELDHLDMFGRLRAVAAPRGTELTTVQLVRTHYAASSSFTDGESGQPSALVVDEVLVTLNDTIGDSFALVDDLRASGMPTLVLGFDFTRESVLDDTFQTELRLGFLRRVELQPDAAASDSNR